MINQLKDQPLISIVISVRNRWGELCECLNSIYHQKNPPNFEIIIVDDGSSEEYQAEIQKFQSLLSIHFLKQIHLGIAAARNLGLSVINGDVILFVDSDCLLEEKCLRKLNETLATHADCFIFQLKLIGSDVSIVTKMEDVRLEATQKELSSENNTILYVNTSGFTIRKSYLNDKLDLFNISLVRGSDTFLFAELYRKNLRPIYAKECVVEHRPDLNLLNYLIKQFWIGYYNSPARIMIAEERLTLPLRKKMELLKNLFIISFKKKTPFIPVLILIAYTFETTGRVAHMIIGIRKGRHSVLHAPVDPVRENELMAQMINAAIYRKGMSVTYLTAWSLILFKTDMRFRHIIQNFDICYADGYGVVFALLLTRFLRIKKVTANDFFFDFCQEISNRGLSIALVGSSDKTIKKMQIILQEKIPELKIAFYSKGYLQEHEEDFLYDSIKKTDPNIIVIGRGQPIQEEWAIRMKKCFPNIVFYCVGGLFDYLTGEIKATPVWIRRLGFEWFHRLIFQPQKCWRRYVFGIPLLFLEIVKYHFLRFVSNDD